MFAAIRLIDLGSPITLIVLYIGLGLFILKLYSWLWRGGSMMANAHESLVEKPPATDGESSAPAAAKPE